MIKAKTVTTVGELREFIKDLPDDAEVCRLTGWYGYYQVDSQGVYVQIAVEKAQRRYKNVAVVPSTPFLRF